VLEKKAWTPAYLPFQLQNSSDVLDDSVRLLIFNAEHRAMEKSIGDNTGIKKDGSAIDREQFATTPKNGVGTEVEVGSTQDQMYAMVDPILDAKMQLVNNVRQTLALALNAC
jgi:hypothetical protein